MKERVLAIAVCALVSACSSTAQKAEPEVAKTPGATTSKVAAAAETDAQRMERIIRILASQSIYFDYDNYAIKPEYQAQLKQDFELLSAEPRLAVRLEGNADERGSTEYNLALGQKRAEAVRRALVMLGVPEAKLEAISYGKEHPRATCHDDSCWAKNRRVDLGERKL